MRSWSLAEKLPLDFDDGCGRDRVFGFCHDDPPDREQLHGSEKGRSDQPSTLDHHAVKLPESLAESAWSTKSPDYFRL